MTATENSPIWSLERRESSGHLVWCKDSPSSKVRFRYDVEVLEFEKHPHEDKHDQDYDFSVNRIASTFIMTVTCVVAFGASIFLPWYLMEKI